MDVLEGSKVYSPYQRSYSSELTRPISGRYHSMIPLMKRYDGQNEIFAFSYLIYAG